MQRLLFKKGHFTIKEKSEMLRKSLVAFLLIFSSNCLANCGAGKITHLWIGGWNSDDIVIQLDNSIQANTLPDNVMFSGNKVRFKKSQVGEFRLANILSAILAAYHTEKPIYTHSHTNDCGNATEVKYYP